jgi:hypothetical protein
LETETLSVEPHNRGSSDFGLKALRQIFQAHSQRPLFASVPENAGILLPCGLNPRLRALLVWIEIGKSQHFHEAVTIQAIEKQEESQIDLPV